VEFQVSWQYVPETLQLTLVFMVLAIPTNNLLELAKTDMHNLHSSSA
jgi:hypothetical protein